MSIDTPTIPPVGATAPPPGRVLVARRRRAGAPGPVGPAVRPLVRLFWIVYLGLNVGVITQAPSQAVGGVIGALLIINAALFPSYLWMQGYVRGLPLFPGYALTFVWAFALPLIENHPIVAYFSSWDQFVGAASITVFLLVGTVAWYPIARRRRPLPAVCWGVSAVHYRPLFLAVLGLCTLWTVAENAGWIQLPGGTASISNAILIATEALTCFVLGFDLGKGKLRGAGMIIFLALLAALIVTILLNLLLINAMALVAIVGIAYTAASKQLPWRIGILIICVFAFLHIGKSDMRGKYWHEEERVYLKPLQYPAFFQDWFDTTMKTIRERDNGGEQGESLLERSSLMHWLLFFQATTPGEFPFLNGATYALIPRMFVPRILDPEKPVSTSAGDMISVYYGIQTPEGTEQTHIAFGLVDEAYANFGFTGMVILGALLGSIYGKVAQWARGMPILSFRALFAMIVASYCFQAEFDSTYYVAAFFQSTIVLILIAFVAMRRVSLREPGISLLD
jgi:hypothetical protein